MPAVTLNAIQSPPPVCEQFWDSDVWVEKDQLIDSQRSLEMDHIRRVSLYILILIVVYTAAKVLYFCLPALFDSVAAFLGYYYYETMRHIRGLIGY